MMSMSHQVLENLAVEEPVQLLSECQRLRMGRGPTGYLCPTAVSIYFCKTEYNTGLPCMIILFFLSGLHGYHISKAAMD